MTKRILTLALISLTTLGFADNTTKPSPLDLAIQKLRKGEELSPEDVYKGRIAAGTVASAFRKKHGIMKSETFYDEPDRTDIFIEYVKLSLIDFQNNGGWVFVSPIRKVVLDELKKRIRKTDDSFLWFCAIFPALYTDQEDYAGKALEHLLKHDKFLAQTAISWSLQVYQDPSWLVDYYTKRGDVKQAREINQKIYENLKQLDSLPARAKFLEQHGKLTLAEAYYAESGKRNRYIGFLVDFYLRHLTDKDNNGISYQEHFAKLRKQCFPKGMNTVELADFTTPPKDGAIILEENDITKKNDLKQGDIVVSMDGYRIQNMNQYYFIRQLDGTNPLMKCIIWNGKQYSPVTVKAKDRRLKVNVETYDASRYSPRALTKIVSPPAVLVDALKTIRAGSRLPEETRQQCKEAFGQYTDTLKNKFGTSVNYQFREPNRTEYYGACIKMALIDPPNHGGWPFRSQLRMTVYDGLKKKAEKTDDPFDWFCLIFPALYTGHDDDAEAALDKLLDRDPFLAETTIHWILNNYEKWMWLADYYHNSKHSSQARKIQDVVVTYIDNSPPAANAGILEGRAKRLEMFGAYSNAEVYLEKIYKKYKYPGLLVDYYRRHLKDDNQDFPFRKRFILLRKRCFPKGVGKADIRTLKDPPERGVIFTEENEKLRRYGLGINTIIVAVDGYRVENEDQYYFIRQLDGDNLRMNLIIWDRNGYRAVGIHDGRRLHANFVSYTRQ